MKKIKFQKFIVQIISLAHKAYGVARIELNKVESNNTSTKKSFVIFVPFSAPGDELEVEITESKKSHAFARIVKIIKASPQRRTPPCPLYQNCGGCNLQHLTYKAQLDAKEQIIQDLLQRHCHIPIEKISPIQGSPNEFHYRSRIQLTHQKNVLGFLKRRSKEILEITTCLLAHPEINKYLKSNNLEKLKSSHEKIQIYYENNHMRVETGSRNTFTQVNTEVNSLMIQYIIKFISTKPIDIIFDLFCGDGNLSRPIEQEFPQISFVGIEHNAQSIQRAKQFNSSVNWINQDVSEYLSQLDRLPANAAFIVDPPRSGCDPHLIDQLIKLKPKLIIYVSCDPMTFVRDVNKLTNYCIIELRPLDMFPQTDHIELIAFLESR